MERCYNVTISGIADLGRKLHIGIGELKGINTKLSLSDGRLMSIDTGITDLNSITN